MTTSHMYVSKNPGMLPDALRSTDNDNTTWFTFGAIAFSSDYIKNKIVGAFTHFLHEAPHSNQATNDYTIDTAGITSKCCPVLYIRTTAETAEAPLMLLRILVQEGLIDRDEAKEKYRPMIERELLETGILSFNDYFATLKQEHRFPRLLSFLPIDTIIGTMNNHIKAGQLNSQTLHDMGMRRMISEGYLKGLLIQCSIEEPPTRFKNQSTPHPAVRQECVDFRDLPDDCYNIYRAWQSGQQMG